MKNCGEKKDLESKGKFDETSFGLDVKKLQWRVPYFNFRYLHDRTSSIVIIEYPMRNDPTRKI